MSFVSICSHSALLHYYLPLLGKKIVDPSSEEGRIRNKDMMEMGFACVLRERTAAERAREDYESKFV